MASCDLWNHAHSVNSRICRLNVCWLFPCPSSAGLLIYRVRVKMYPGEKKVSQKRQHFCVKFSGIILIHVFYKMRKKSNVFALRPCNWHGRELRLCFVTTLVFSVFSCIMPAIFISVAICLIVNISSIQYTSLNVFGATLNVWWRWARVVTFCSVLCWK